MSSLFTSPWLGLVPELPWIWLDIGSLSHSWITLGISLSSPTACLWNLSCALAHSCPLFCPLLQSAAMRRVILCLHPRRVAVASLSVQESAPLGRSIFRRTNIFHVDIDYLMSKCVCTNRYMYIYTHTHINMYDFFKFFLQWGEEWWEQKFSSSHTGMTPAVLGWSPGLNKIRNRISLASGLGNNKHSHKL